MPDVDLAGCIYQFDLSPFQPHRRGLCCDATDDCLTSRDAIEEMSMQTYRELVGALAWLALGTRTRPCSSLSRSLVPVSTQGMFIGRLYQSNCFSCSSLKGSCNRWYESPSGSQVHSPKFLQHFSDFFFGPDYQRYIYIILHAQQQNPKHAPCQSCFRENRTSVLSRSGVMLFRAERRCN
jgi:hypothetical protein